MATLRPAGPAGSPAAARVATASNPNQGSPAGGNAASASRPIAAAGSGARPRSPARRRRLGLGLEEMHGRLGEVLQPARVVEVEVGQHDVPHVARGNPSRSIGGRRSLRVEADVEQVGVEPAQPRERLPHVAQAQAGVDQASPSRSVSTRRQWHTRCPIAPRLTPSISRPPNGRTCRSSGGGAHRGTPPAHVAWALNGPRARLRRRAAAREVPPGAAYISGMLKSAPARMPVGQRLVTALSLV